MIADIENFLKSSQDFNIGVELYLRYSEDKTLKSLFLSGQTSYSKSKLLHALKEISISHVVAEYPAPKIPDVEKFRTKRDANVIQINFSELPPNLKDRFRQKDALYKQAREMHGILGLDMTSDERRKIALEIIQNFSEIDDIWKEAEDYQEKGISRVPVVRNQEHDQLTALDLANLRDNYKKNLYKVKGIDGKEARYRELVELIKEVEDALQKR